MADLRKLGKRDSYRLGGRRPGAWAGRDGAMRRAGRAPARLTFGAPRSRTGPGRWAAVSVAGAAVIAVAAETGLWFMPFAAGVVTGAASRRAGWRARRALLAAGVMAVAGWGAPLLWQAVRGEPAGATARVIAALGGLPPHAAFGVIVTLAVACLQAVAGLWLGRAVMPASGPR
jgi:hypothetical protein